MIRTLERISGTMRTAPESATNTRQGLTHQIDFTDWRAAMDSTHEASDNFRHPDRWNSTPVPERVATRALERVDKREDGCWISLYSVASHGYAQIGWQDSGARYVVLAHRAAWVAVNGQMPLGMTLDHTCKVRPCVNPSHLRMLPNFENARRVHGKDWPMGFCANGHPNSSLRPKRFRNKSGGWRMGVTCRECTALYNARYEAKKRAA